MTQNNDGIDERILTKIAGKDIFYVSTILMRDLHKRNPLYLQRWKEVYDREPSCRDIQDGSLYHKLMLEKYLRVYLACQIPEIT